MLVVSPHRIAAWRGRAPERPSISRCRNLQRTIAVTPNWLSPMNPRELSIGVYSLTFDGITVRAEIGTGG
jgi:hypothetical protein